MKKLFGLRETPSDGLVLFKKIGHLDTLNNLIPCIDIPTASCQTEYIWSEGPGHISTKDVTKWLSPDEVFFFLRAQIVFERISKRFANLKSFIPIEDGIIFVCDQLLIMRARDEIATSVVGVYMRDNIFFCAGQKCKGSLSELQKTLLNQKIPCGFEISRSNSDSWTTNYCELRNKSAKAA